MVSRVLGLYENHVFSVTKTKNVFFLLIMCGLLNAVCDILLNVLHYKTTWCASYVGIKIMLSLFTMGLKVSLKLIFFT